MIVAAPGYDRGVRWLRRLFGSDDSEPTAARQQGDPTVLEDPDDPRSTDEYKTADPREIVEHAGTAMSGPGGAPQENLSPGERRELDRRDD